jgi:monoamine oxidase
MIAFDPPLPSWKQEAIDHLSMGYFNKLVLVFPKLFWDENIDTFGFVNAPNSEESDPRAYAAVRGKFYLFWNMYAVTQEPILVSFISGKAAELCELQTDEEIARDAMDVLKSIFHEKKRIPEPIKILVSRWNQEPFAMGSYSSISTSGSGEDYDLMGKSVFNKLFWAGEATNRQYPATVHGNFSFFKKKKKELYIFYSNTPL